MLSIIIPTLNEEKYLPLLLEEIKKQNFDDLEIIVADGGSEDQTVEIAKNYGCKIAPGGSPAIGRNEGAKVASGDLLLFLDADIIFLPPQFLKNLLEEFKNRNLDLASFPVYPQGKIIDKIAYQAYNFWVRLTQNFLPHATEAVLIKKEIHQKIGGFDEEIKIGEDHIYVRSAKKFGKFGFINIDPLITSSRRFDRDGRFKTYLKYLLAGAHMIFLGPVKSDIFKYRFKVYNRDIKNQTMPEQILLPRPNPFFKRLNWRLVIIGIILVILIGGGLSYQYGLLPLEKILPARLQILEKKLPEVKIKPVEEFIPPLLKEPEETEKEYSQQEQKVGELAENLMLEEIRTGDHLTFFRIVFDIKNLDGSDTSIIPFTEAKYLLEENKIEIVSKGIEKNLAQKERKILDPIVNSYLEQKIENQKVKYIISLTKESNYYLFSLLNPARIVVDIQK